jgi:hypothetical protein
MCPHMAGPFAAAHIRGHYGLVTRTHLEALQRHSLDTEGLPCVLSRGVAHIPQVCLTPPHP